VSARDWLTARPIAHRGLHEASRGVIENSRAAARAAIARGFAIECDVERSADGEAFVFHDASLDRLTSASGAVTARDARQLAAIELKGGGETLPSFAEFLTVVGGAVPLICEIKSHFGGDFRLADRVAALAAGYAGPLAFKSFDPEIVGHLRARNLRFPLGVVAQASYDDPYFEAMSAERKQSARAFLHIGATRPDFLSWAVDDLPHATPTLMRALGPIPVVTWTVRSPEQKRRAQIHADQIVFEVGPD
jgi:glycerophosphoryl diester phosphodiesterase